MKNLIQVMMSYKMIKGTLNITIVNYKAAPIISLLKGLFFIICVFISFSINAQSNTVVLPSDGTNTRSSAPQGALRYQRGFYLIQGNEMSKSGLSINDSINCIAFTLGAAQSDTTKGKFKVYLQNTTDVVSRLDTSWALVPGILTNYYTVNNVFPANYEWQVISNCSDWTTSYTFSNNDLDPCQPPTRLLSTAISESGATLTWVGPAMGVVKYFIEYKTSNAVIWTLDSSLTTSLNLSSLSSNTGYQWRVKTKCATDTSIFAQSQFTTSVADVCSEPSGLLVVATTDTLVKLKWTAAPGADYYTIRFRRAGTYNWVSTLSFTDSLTIDFGLDTGTIYEWQVKTNCGFDSSGLFVSGTNFTTTGLTACYTPDQNISQDSITASSFKFSWDSVAGATSYSIRFRAKDIINWTNAIAPMQLVHNDSICIPDTTGPYYTYFKGPGIDTFVYSGDGVYVAWEYEMGLGNLSSPNTTLSNMANTSIKGYQGQDSIHYILSLISLGDSTATALDTILHATDTRPETRLCSSSLKDSVEVVAVYALGKYAQYTAAPVSALIRNYSGSTQTYVVSMTVKDKATNAIRYTNSQNLMVGPDTIGLIEFNGWTPSLFETDSIIISIPAQFNENVANNNSNFYIQMVTKNIVSFDDGSNVIAEAGTDTSAGITISRYFMNGCGKINAVQVYLSESAAGHAVYAIALDTNKVILAQSSAFTPDSTQTNVYHTFYFNNTRLLKNEEYYIGLAQTASPNGYNPVGVQWEGGQIRDSAYYRGRINGDSIWHHPSPGRLMIRAVLVPGVASPIITGDLFLCSGTMDTLFASSIDARYADSVLNYSSQYTNDNYSANDALGTPDVYPLYGANAGAWISGSDTSRQYLTLKFSNPDSVNFVDIYETLNPGALDSVYLKDDGTGLYNLIWSGTAGPTGQVAKNNRITFSLTPYKVSAVRLSFNVTAVPGYSAIDAVCIGRITTPGVFPSISWTGPSTGSNTSLIISAPGTYTLTTTDPNGCAGSDSVISITPVQTIPIITAGGPLTFCPGDSVSLRSSFTGGNIWSTGATTDSIYVKIPGSYTVLHDDGSGCGTTMSVATMVNNFIVPAVAITGNLTICPGGSTILHASPGFASYYWSTASTADSIVTFIAGEYLVTAIDANGCSIRDTVNTIFGVEPIPSITGTFVFCPGDSTVLTANGIATSYLWEPTGETTSTITVKTGDIFTVKLTNADGCSASTAIGTSVYPSPIAGILSPDGFCPMDSVVLSSDDTHNGYLWSTGNTTPSITVNMAGVYTLTVIDANGCKDSVSKNIIQFVPPSAFISGTLSFCNGGSATTLDAGLGYSSYLWSTGETSNSIVVSTIGTFIVTVTDANGCSDSASATTSLEGSIPAVPGPITGSLFGMCNTLSPSMYSVSPVLNSTCYKWKVPEGATIVSGYMADSSVFFNSIKVVFDNTFTGGYIEVAAHNDCGSSPTFNGQRIYVSAAPGSVPGNISGTTTGVCKLGMETYSIPPINTAISYNWTVPLGAMILTGQGTASIDVFFASSYRTGDICVQYSTACGTSPFSCVSVSPGPRIDSLISGPAIVCASAANIMYSIPIVDGTTAYEWTVPTGAIILSGQGTNIIKVAFGTHAGIVTVVASNVCGSSNSQFINVAIGNCFVSPSDRWGKDNSLYDQMTIQIFPNPSEGIVHLIVQSQSLEPNTLLTVTDAMGRVVHTQKVLRLDQKQYDLDLRRLNKGLYFISLKSERESIVTKVLLR